MACMARKKRDYWLRANSTKTMQRYARCESKFALIMDLFVYMCPSLSACEIYEADIGAVGVQKSGVVS